MTARIHVHSRARIDIQRHALYIAQFDAKRGRRFLTTTQQTLKKLAAQPGLGGPVEIDDPRFGAWRVQPIKDFPNYLIFYREIDSGIEVMRVLGSTMDLEAELTSG